MHPKLLASIALVGLLSIFCIYIITNNHKNTDPSLVGKGPGKHSPDTRTSASVPAELKHKYPQLLTK